MSANKVLFVSRNSINNLAGDWRDWACISISEPTAPGEASIEEEQFSGLLRASFHDVIPGRSYDEPFQLMAATDAEKIVEFFLQHRDGVCGFIITCKAGISRSAAVAKWVSGALGLPFNQDYGHFNTHVYRLLQEAAERSGALKNLHGD